MTQNSQPRLSGDLRQEGGEIPAVRGGLPEALVSCGAFALLLSGSKKPISPLPLERERAGTRVLMRP